MELREYLHASTEGRKADRLKLLFYRDQLGGDDFSSLWTLAEELEEVLGIQAGHTTPDGLFTLNATRCLGACGLAPVMMINEDVYGRLTPDEIPGIIAKYRS